MANQSFSRREFIRLVTGGTAAVLISFNTACRNKISRWRFFNEEEITLLDAIVEQLVPTDDFPGAGGQMCQILSISSLILITGNIRLPIVKALLH